MTSTIARPTTPQPGSTAVRSAAGRFTAALVSFGTIVAAAVDATRALQSARTPHARRAVVEHFAAAATPPADRRAA